MTTQEAETKQTSKMEVELTVLEERICELQLEASALTSTITKFEEDATALMKKVKNAESAEEEASWKEKYKHVKKSLKTSTKTKREADKQAQRLKREFEQKQKGFRFMGGKEENFGDLPLLQSQAQKHETKNIEKKIWTPIEELKPSIVSKEVLVRGHLQKSQSVGKCVFVTIRSTIYSVQGVAFRRGSVSSAMIQYISALALESVVEVRGAIKIPEEPIMSVSQKMVEINIESVHCVSKANKSMPFDFVDACQSKQQNGTPSGQLVGQQMRLEYRWLDLRTPPKQAIFRIQSMVCCLFREFLTKKGFIEIHTPKIISGGSAEGGSEVFRLQYFGQPASLTMSPQLHKQMAAACCGFERIFEIGPVFRAENANTSRHLCEFTGLDLEMTIREHYHEILEVLGELFIFIFEGINERCQEELQCVRAQYPFKNLKYSKTNTLKISFAEGYALLRESGIEHEEYGDLNTENEKKLGEIVKEKYGTDFFLVERYPLAVRPFFTMPNLENPKLSNSYDFFIRGQEILSGSQRIHEPSMLEERAKSLGINPKDIEFYLNSFNNGASPHGGGGIGLERVVMLFLGLSNIRQTSMLPRTPKRLTP